MDNLIGKHFHIEYTDYVIVDVRNIKGDTLIYAESAVKDAVMGRTAFRYVDIERHVEPAPELA